VRPRISSRAANRFCSIPDSTRMSRAKGTLHEIAYSQRSAMSGSTRDARRAGM
jgi:hypothetical protein